MTEAVEPVTPEVETADKLAHVDATAFIGAMAALGAGESGLVQDFVTSDAGVEFLANWLRSKLDSMAKGAPVDTVAERASGER